MNASATSDFSPPESSDSRFVAFPAGVTSISIPGVSKSKEESPDAAKASSGSVSGPPWTAVAGSAPKTGSSVLSSAPSAAKTAFGRGMFTRRSRPEPPGNSRPITSSKLRAAASNVSSKLSRMRRSVSRISPRSSASAASRSVRWVSSSSTCARASSYSRSASGLTGPRRSRRRSRRSSRAASSVRSSSERASACSCVSPSPSPRRSPIAATLRCHQLLAVAHLRHPHLILGEGLARLAQAALQLVLAPCQLAQLGGEALAARLVGAQLPVETLPPRLGCGERVAQ